MACMRENAHHKPIEREKCEQDRRRCRADVSHQASSEQKNQNNRRDIDEQQACMNAARRLAEHRFDRGIRVIRAREFHVVFELVGWNAVQDQLPGIRIFTLVALERNIHHA